MFTFQREAEQSKNFDLSIPLGFSGTFVKKLPNYEGLPEEKPEKFKSWQYKSF